jgi:hypothetical protein
MMTGEGRLRAHVVWMPTYDSEHNAAPSIARSPGCQGRKAAAGSSEGDRIIAQHNLVLSAPFLARRM